MPAAPDNPSLARQPSVRTGELHEATVKSSVLTMANPRTVWVYMPPGPPLPNQNLLIVFDGGTTYQYRIPTTTILDNLYAVGKIGQTVAVCVDNGGEARALEMTFSDSRTSTLSIGNQNGLSVNSRTARSATLSSTSTWARWRTGRKGMTERRCSMQLVISGIH